MSKTGRKDPGLDGRHRDRGMILGLAAFEKISAVEGVRLSNEMRRDIQAMISQDMDGAKRTRLVNRKYGKA